MGGEGRGGGGSLNFAPSVHYRGLGDRKFAFAKVHTLQHLLLLYFRCSLHTATSKYYAIENSLRKGIFNIHKETVTETLPLTLIIPRGYVPAQKRRLSP